MKDGQQLTLKLQELGVKKKRLAELLGVHPNTITQWLNKENIDSGTRRKIARALTIVEEDIFHQDDYRHAERSTLPLREPSMIYRESTSSLKKLDALQYCGLLSKGEDGLELQRKWRAEW